MDGELSTRGINVITTGLASCHADIGLVEEVEKVHDSVAAGPFVGCARMFVVGDEVDFGVDAFGELDQPLGVLVAVVESIDERILQGNGEPHTGHESLVSRECIKEPVDAVLLVNGHQVITDFVSGRVERDGKADGVAFAEFEDLGAQSCCRHGDAAFAESDASFVCEQLKGFHQIVEIDEWFAHPHKHDVGDVLVGWQGAAGFNELGHILANGQVAAWPHTGGVTKLATERTSHLRRDTERIALVLRDQDRFDAFVVVKPEQKLAGAIL